MSDTAFVTRIAQTLQAHRDTILSLQELAGELTDFTQRARELADRLEATPAVRATLVHVPPGPYEGTLDMSRMPAVLRNGPLPREG